LYVVGAPPPAVAAPHGDFEGWFRRITGELDLELEAVDGQGARLPRRLAEYAGFVITGSPASLTEPEAWMEGAVELIRHAYAERVPLLGVCFGHQLIGAAFGGSVVANPAGWEMSTYDIEVHQPDPLFEGLPDRFAVNFSHRDIIDPATLSPMNGVQVLAGNRAAAVQVVAAGPCVRGVQFHPEMTGAIVSAYIEARAEGLADDARARGDDGGHPEARLARASDSPAGERVYRNFLQHWIIEPAGASLAR
jgi:GMP synthase (glutamine-hydrolysing)